MPRPTGVSVLALSRLQVRHYANANTAVLAPALFDFQTNFEFLYEEFKLPMTLKIHVIIDHYSDYFMWTGKTMKYTNAEFTETAHSTFKMSECIHKFKVTRKIGTPVHKELALKSLCGITLKELVMSHQLSLG